MLMPLARFDLDCLLRELAQHYQVTGTRVRFVPLGEDSWAYQVDRLWLSVRRDLRGHVPGAYQLAYDLWVSGVDCVLAPLPGADGKVVREVDGLPVVVFPYLEVSPLTGLTLSYSDLEQVVAVIGRLHAYQGEADIPVEDFRLSFEADLNAALDGIPEAEAGPYARRFQRPIETHRDRIVADRAEIAELGPYCAAHLGQAVATNGEPSAPNILVNQGRFLLADSWPASSPNSSSR